MNPRGLVAVCAITLAALTGCQRTEVTTETFVNKADARQVLKLESKPALRYDFWGRSGNAESTAGAYTLNTGTGTISGTYTYVVDSGNNLRQYTFHPQQGAAWTARLDSRGSFTDEKGNLWRIQQFKKDATMHASLQIGK
jgi:hypothetical protein